MKQKIEALTLAFNIGFKLGTQYTGKPTDHSMRAALKRAIEEGLKILASQPVVEADAESRCPKCGEIEPVLCCENCGHKWSRTA